MMREPHTNFDTELEILRVEILKVGFGKSNEVLRSAQPIRYDAPPILTS